MFGIRPTVWIAVGVLLACSNFILWPPPWESSTQAMRTSGHSPSVRPSTEEGEHDARSAAESPPLDPTRTGAPAQPRPVDAAGDPTGSATTLRADTASGGTASSGDQATQRSDANLRANSARSDQRNASAVPATPSTFSSTVGGLESALPDEATLSSSAGEQDTRAALEPIDTEAGAVAARDWRDSPQEFAGRLDPRFETGDPFVDLLVRRRVWGEPSLLEDPARMELLIDLAQDTTRRLGPGEGDFLLQYGSPSHTATGQVRAFMQTPIWRPGEN